MRFDRSLIFHVSSILVIAYGQDIKFATDCITPNNAQGLCVEVQKCKKLYDQIVQDNVKTFTFIRASRCGPPNEDLEKPKVCCGPDIDFVRDIVDSNLSSNLSVVTTPVPPLAGHSVLPRICGKQKIFLENKIFGGKEAGVGEFPWLGRMVHYNRYNRSGLGCSAFLIHRKFILTAAHCLTGKGVEHLGQLRSVIFGIHNDTKAPVCSDQMCTDPPRNVDALSYIIHPQYDSNIHSNDIALIQLKERIDFTDFIKAICLPRQTTSSSWFVISGWGRTESDTTSRTKLKVDIPRANRTQCEAQYKTVGLTLSEEQICAGGERGHDSCSGDSGGPLMAMGDQNLWYAEGIVSYGNSCGREGWPGVYTYIPKYYNWIVQEIKAALKQQSTAKF